MNHSSQTSDRFFCFIELNGHVDRVKVMYDVKGGIDSNLH